MWMKSAVAPITKKFFKKRKNGSDVKTVLIKSQSPEFTEGSPIQVQRRDISYIEILALCVGESYGKTLTS